MIICYVDRSDLDKRWFYFYNFNVKMEVYVGVNKSGNWFLSKPNGSDVYVDGPYTNAI